MYLCLLASVPIVLYHLFLCPKSIIKPHIWAPKTPKRLNSSVNTDQNKYIWNFGAPLASDVSLDLSRRDGWEKKDLRVDPNLVPVSVLIHEAESFPSNITLTKLVYQLWLFIAGAIILKTYIVPEFKLT